MTNAHFLDILSQRLLVKGACSLLICSLLKPVVPVSIVRGVGPIVPDMMEPR